MNISLRFPLPGNRKVGVARRKGKPPAHWPPPAVEALEELTVPSAMPGPLRAVSALVPSRPAITAPLALSGSPSLGAIQVPGGIPAQVSNSRSLQAPLPGASKVLSTLASNLQPGVGQLSGITGSALHGTVQQLAGATQVVGRGVGRALTQQLGAANGGTAPLIDILLSNRLSNPGAILSNLGSLAGSPTANTVQQLDRVLTGVTGNLNNAASNLRALSIIQSGTTATGDARALLDRLMPEVASSVSTVLSSLNTLVGVLPDLMSLAVSYARQFLQSALMDITNRLGVITGSLDKIADQFAGVVGSRPGDGLMASAAADRSASPPSDPRSFVGGVLTEVSDLVSTIANLLSTLAGSLSSVLAGATPATSGPSSSAAGTRQIIDTIFGSAA